MYIVPNQQGEQLMQGNTIKILFTSFSYAHEEIYFKEYVFKNDDFYNHWLNEFLK